MKKKAEKCDNCKWDEGQFGVSHLNVVSVNDSGECIKCRRQYVSLRTKKGIEQKPMKKKEEKKIKEVNDQHGGLWFEYKGKKFFVESPFAIALLKQLTPSNG